MRPSPIWSRLVSSLVTISVVVELLSDTYDADELRPHGERFTHEQIQAHVSEQAGWPVQTDCDRLDAAFADLEQAGIIARHDFSCRRVAERHLRCRRVTTARRAIYA